MASIWHPHGQIEWIEVWILDQAKDDDSLVAEWIIIPYVLEKSSATNHQRNCGIPESYNLMWRALHAV